MNKNQSRLGFVLSYSCKWYKLNVSQQWMKTSSLIDKPGGAGGQYPQAEEVEQKKP
jgi:hypothetical protein